MPENLPDHAHCQECDAAIPEGGIFCSDQCERSFKGRAKKDRQRNTLFIAIVVIVALGLSLLSVFL